MSWGSSRRVARRGCRPEPLAAIACLSQGRAEGDGRLPLPRQLERPRRQQHLEEGPLSAWLAGRRSLSALSSPRAKASSRAGITPSPPSSRTRGSSSSVPRLSLESYSRSRWIRRHERSPRGSQVPAYPGVPRLHAGHRTAGPPVPGHLPSQAAHGPARAGWSDLRRASLTEFPVQGDGGGGRSEVAPREEELVGEDSSAWLYAAFCQQVTRQERGRFNES